MGYYLRSINRQGISSLSPVAMRFYKKSISYKHTRELEIIPNITIRLRRWIH